MAVDSGGGPAEGGLLEVELDGLPGRADADRNPEQVADAARLPHVDGVQPGDVPQAEHVRQLGRADQTVLVAAGLGEPVGRQAPGQRIGLEDADAVRRADPVDVVAVADAEPARARDELKA